MHKAYCEEEAIVIRAERSRLDGELCVPKGADGIVVFAHGSGSSRFSPRNRFVAERLQAQRLATLLFDLLTPEEEEAERYAGALLRFDIGLLAKRLVAAIDWLDGRQDLRGLRVGCFGASTGAAAALVAAARRPGVVESVVSRGGRPELAAGALEKVRAATLLIVGEKDTGVVELNQEAFALLQCEKKLELIPGATHLFEESGALEEVARLAGDWFKQHLAGSHPQHQKISTTQ